MADPAVLNHALFNVSVEDCSVELVEPDADGRDFDEFSRIMLTELIANEKSKQYSFTDENELVVSHVRSITKNELLENTSSLQSNWLKRTESIALKLLEVEIKAQERIAAMDKKIKKGSLLILHLEHDGLTRFVILKIEVDSFFDEIEARIRRGLPLNKQRLQKSCLVTLNSSGEVTELLLSDSGRTIREYWWGGFLSSKEMTTAGLNTKTAYDAVDFLLKQTVKKLSEPDYIYMRNDVNSYFRNNESFIHTELVERLEAHNIESQVFKDKFPNFIEKLKKLPTNPKAKFDTQFDLDQSVIKTKLKSNIFLDENLELRIMGDIPNIKEIIRTGTDQDGKFIKIYSDTGYNAFVRQGN